MRTNIAHDCPHDPLLVCWLQMTPRIRQKRQAWYKCFDTKQFQEDRQHLPEDFTIIKFHFHPQKEARRRINQQPTAHWSLYNALSSLEHWFDYDHSRLQEPHKHRFFNTAGKRIVIRSTQITCAQKDAKFAVTRRLIYDNCTLKSTFWDNYKVSWHTLDAILLRLLTCHSAAARRLFKSKLDHIPDISWGYCDQKDAFFNF